MDDRLRTPAKQQAKAVKAEAEDTAAMLCDWSGGLLGAVAQAAYADRLAEALRAGQAYAELFEKAKRARGLVDFNDLIRETRGCSGPRALATGSPISSTNASSTFLSTSRRTPTNRNGI